MFIECFKNNGTPYLRVTESYRANEGNDSKCKRRTVRNIGPLSRFNDGKPDYLARLRTSFAAERPLIESLSDLVEGKPVPKRIIVEYDLKNEGTCYSNPHILGYFVLDGLHDALGIYDVLNKHKSMTKIEYDLNGLTKLLVFGRALRPDSKIETFKRKNHYAFDVSDTEIH